MIWNLIWCWSIHVSVLFFKSLISLQCLHWESAHELLITRLKAQCRPGFPGGFHRHWWTDVQGEHLALYLGNCTRSSAHTHTHAYWHQVREAGVAVGGGVVKWVLNFTGPEERRSAPLHRVCNGDGGDTAGNSNGRPSQKQHRGIWAWGWHAQRRSTARKSLHWDISGEVNFYGMLCSKTKAKERPAKIHFNWQGLCKVSERHLLFLSACCCQLKFSMVLL